LTSFQFPPRTEEEKPDVQDAHPGSRICRRRRAAAPDHAEWPLSTNDLSVDGLSANAIEAHAALNDRVVGIELPSTTGETR
jgi:hypothetical protein